MAASSEILQIIIRARDEMSSSVNAARGSIKQFNDNIQGGVAKIREYQFAILGVVGVAAGLGKIVSEYAGVEEKMLYVNTIARKSSEGLAAMTEQVRELAKEYGLLGTEAPDALYDIYSNLGETGRNLDLLNKSARASVGGLVDVKDTASSATGVINAMGDAVGNAGRIFDIQFKTIERGRVVYRELAQNSGQFLANARAAGQGYAEVMGGYATLTKNLATPSIAATSLNTFMGRFTDPEFVNGMRNLGIQVVDNEGKFRSYVDVIGELNEKLSTMSDYAKAQIVKKLVPGEEAKKAFLTLLGNFDVFAEDVREIMENSAGAAEAAYGTMADSISHKMKILKAEFRDLVLDMGEDLVRNADSYMRVLSFGIKGVAGTVQMAMGVIQGAMATLASIPVIGLQFKATFTQDAAVFEEAKRRAAAVEKLFTDAGKEIIGGGTKIWEGLYPEDAEIRKGRSFIREMQLFQEDMKTLRAGGAAGGGDNKDGGGQTGVADPEKIEKLLQTASRLKEKYLELDAGNRIEALQEEMEAVRRAGGDTLGYELAIAKEKEAIYQRLREKTKAFVNSLGEMYEAHAARRREINDMIAQMTMSRNDYERYQAKATLDVELEAVKQKSGAEREQMEKLARLRYELAMKEADAEREAETARKRRGLRALELETGGDPFAVRREQTRQQHQELMAEYEDLADGERVVREHLAAELKKIDADETAWKKSQAGAYREFNLAQLQTMLADERTAQEDRYRIQKEINERIAADDVTMQEAKRMGMRQVTQEFLSDAQIWMQYGRSTANSMRENFSNIFFNSMKGEINSITDVWNDMLNSIRDSFLRAMSDLIAKRLVIKLFALAGGGEDSGSGGLIAGGLALLGGLFGSKGGGGGLASLGFAAKGGVFPGPLRQIAQFANGGVVRRPTLAVVGEGGGPEAVVPLAGGAIPVRFEGLGSRVSGLGCRVKRN